MSEAESFAHRVAIIGAGMAGLACATQLAKFGLQPVLFDKGRGPGGRMATRRAETEKGQLRFDHGAQYFTARDPAFIATIGKWYARGVVAAWPAAGEGAYVGTPGMNAPLRAMASELEVQWGKRVLSVAQEGDGWLLEVDGKSEQFTHCVVAVPAEQAAELLQGAAPQYAAQAAASVSDPCWAVMASFASPLPIEQDSLRSRDADISWAARNSAKPGRGDEECWVLHASPDYSREILEDAAADVAPKLLAKFFDQAGIAPVEPAHLAAHRWRFAQAQKPAAEGSLALWDRKAKLGVAGDWLVEPRVEGAWRSGRAAAEMLIDSL